jgi:hypothetical protein
VACTTEDANIPGLYLLHDFITEQEEQQLLAAIDQQPWLQLSKRRVQHYGYRFEYTTRGVDLKEKAGAIPDWQQQVVQRVQVRAVEQSWGWWKLQQVYPTSAQGPAVVIGASGSWHMAKCKHQSASTHILGGRQQWDGAQHHAQAGCTCFVTGRGVTKHGRNTTNLTLCAVSCCGWCDVLCAAGAARCSRH